MPLPVQTSEGSFYNAEIIKEIKTRMEFFINPETGRRAYNSLCLKCKTNASKATKQSLFFVRNTNQKEVQKALKIAVNMTTAVNLI